MAIDVPLLLCLLGRSEDYISFCKKICANIHKYVCCILHLFHNYIKTIHL